MKYYWHKNLLFLMKEHNLDCTQLAEKAELNRNTVLAIQNGQTKNPGILTIARIVKVFNISYDDFMFKNIGK